MRLLIAEDEVDLVVGDPRAYLLGALFVVQIQGYGQTGEGHAGIDGRRNCRVKRECTFLYRRGKETQGRRLLPVKKRYTSG